MKISLIVIFHVLYSFQIKCSLQSFNQELCNIIAQLNFYQSKINFHSRTFSKVPSLPYCKISIMPGKFSFKKALFLFPLSNIYITGPLSVFCIQTLIIIIQLMDLKTLILFTLFVNLLLSQQIDLGYNYTTFIKQFGKQETEEGKKFFQFNYNQYLLDLALNKSVSINQYFDQPNNGRFGFKINQNIPISSRPLSLTTSLFASPTTFDWRVLGRVTPAKNQNLNGCGSCWAFSTVGQYQSAIAIATNGTLIDLSEQYIVQCQRNSSGCQGGDPFFAVHLANRTGIPLESRYPYKGINMYYTNNGQAICSDTNRVKLNIAVTQIQRYTSNTIQQIQSDLISYGPMSIALDATNWSGSNTDGNIVCRFTELNHAVLLVGYTSTHWIVKNSWGQAWGANGFAFVPKSSDCGLSKYVVPMKVQYDSPVPPPPPPIVSNISLTITMRDSGSNGWQGNKFAFRQNGVIVAQFGSTFTNGSFLGPISVTIDGKKQTQIICSSIGYNPRQVTFVIKYSNGTLNYNKTVGNFSALTIFNTFCALGGCPPSTLALTITMSDFYGDGWQRTVLAFRQNSVKVGTFGEGFTNNFTYGPITVNIPGSKTTQIVPHIIGDYVQQIGFIVKAPNGTTIIERSPGNVFNSTSILGSFCPLGQCGYVAPAKYFITLTMLPTASKMIQLVKRKEN